MEEYEIENTLEERTVKQGKYYGKIFAKHCNSYGKAGAIIIRDNIVSTFIEAMNQVQNPSMNSNMLLVGKVQSGKTSNLELFTALSLDNGYNMVVIYGGYDNTLLSQTMNRFKKSFDIPNDTNYASDAPVVFSSDDSNQLLAVDDEIIEDLLEADKPIFLISMKRPAAMEKVNNLLRRINKIRLKAFIIDDEGDQASLNTRKNKKKEASATYSAIVEMKNQLKSPLYLSVTATPQALVFLDEFSQLRPDTIRLIEPGKGYCGCDAYHLYDSDIIEIVGDNDQQELTDGRMPKSLKNAIQHYIIASAIMKKRGCPTSEMIVHSHRNVSDHSAIYCIVDAYVQSLKDAILYDDVASTRTRKEELKKAYEAFFSEPVRREYRFDELWDIICSDVICRIYVILKNSAGQVTQATEALRKHKIYIGGDLLQRGVTFPSLVTTYFLRWAKDSGNMDTNLQRARWFGYREKYIDICKLFTSSDIAREFTNLSEIETDLWEQFYSIQSGEMNIEDILVRADNTKQKPTRKNVASYTTVTFKNKWIMQRIGIFDELQIKQNDATVNDLIHQLKWENTSAGRRDGRHSAKCAIAPQCLLTQLFDHLQTIFDLEPFERKPLKDLIANSKNIPIILMNGIDEEGTRVRSFYDNNRIYALHQGADSKIKEKAKFLGDSYVIVEKENVNIQIHRIVPKKKDKDGNMVMKPEYAQYMFAIYVPKEKKYFVKECTK